MKKFKLHGVSGIGNGTDSCPYIAFEQKKDAAEFCNTRNGTFVKHEMQTAISYQLFESYQEYEQFCKDENERNAREQEIRKIMERMTVADLHTLEQLASGILINK